MVILADFILEFRFEFLWPFWLLLRSVYDSFKYQGLVSINVTQLWIMCEIILYIRSQTYYFSSRPSLYFLFVLHLHQTWFASFSSLCIGYSLLPALMFGCNMFGTQVCIEKTNTYMYKHIYMHKHKCQIHVCVYVYTYTHARAHICVYTCLSHVISCYLNVSRYITEADSFR